MSNLLEIREILDQIGATSSKNDKVAIVKKHKDNKLFKDVVFWALNPRFSYFMKKVPAIKPIASMETSLFGDELKDGDKSAQMFDLLDKLRLRYLSGNSAIAAVEDFRTYLNDEEDDLFVRVLIQNLRIGATESTFNKVWGDTFIRKVPCIKARELSDKNLANIKFPAYVQTKFDGTRCIAQKIDGTIFLQSRNGSIFTGLQDIASEVNDLLKHAPDGSFIDGEIVFQDIYSGDFLPRKKSNGLATKSIKGSLSQKDMAGRKPTYNVWDVVYEGDHKKRYRHRLVDLAHMDLIHLQLAYPWVVDSVEEVNELYQQQRAEGQEGVILKNMDAPWENTRSKHLVKFKAFAEADLRVVRAEKGEVRSKNEHVLGRLICVTDDGMIEVAIGGGYSDKEREELLDIEPGTIVTSKFNDIIESDTKPGMWSLYIPSFVEVRYDKNQTSTYEELVDQVGKS
jgi:hypothetical protein